MTAATYAAAVGQERSAPTCQCEPFAAIVLQHRDGSFSPMVVSSQGTLLWESELRSRDRALIEAVARRKRRLLLAEHAREEQ